jgi:hypothetical protein
LGRYWRRRGSPLQFYDVLVEEINDFDWKSRVGGNVDLVYLPEAVFSGDDSMPHRQLRIVTGKDLLGHFGLIKATKVFARPRRRL